MSDDVFTKEENDAWNSYFYPGTETFINKFGITDIDELDKKEAECTFVRLAELQESDIEGDFNSEKLCKIHEYIFQDLYPWAGKFRDVHMAKNDSNFTDHRKIKEYLNYELDLMNKEIKDVHSLDMYKSFLADYYITLLNIHPFRDGNGRTIREYLREFTRVKTEEIGLGNYDLDWSKASEEEMDKYMPLARFVKSPIEMALGKTIVNLDDCKKM